MNERAPETTLILVRHGESDWNAEGRVQGQVDSSLTARGRDQVQKVAARLARTHIAAVYASDVGRARESAALIAAPHGLAVNLHPGLRERCYGVLEGKILDELAQQECDWLSAWRADRQRLAPPGGETQPEMSRRVMAALRHIAAAHPGETVAVVTHGGPIKSALFALLQIPISSWDLTWIANGSLTLLRGAPDLLRLASFNDTAHLDQEPTPTWRTADIGRPS